MANGRIDENGLPVYAPGDFDYVRVVDRSTGASRNALAPEVTAAARQLSDALGQIVADAEADIAPVIAGLGYLPPVPYASGLNVDSTRFTVIRDGQVYAPAAPVPFTTGAWSPGQWRLVQGVTGADLASETGAAMLGFRQSGANAVMRHVLAKLLEQPKTPEDFGATGNGASDDTTAMRRFLTAGGGDLRPGATYLVSGVLDMPSNSRLSCIRGRAAIRLAGGSNSTVIRATGASNVTVENIEVDGNEAGQSTGEHYGVLFLDCDGVTIRNVYAHDTVYPPVRLRNCTRISVDTLECSRSPADGLKVTNCSDGDFVNIITTQVPYVANRAAIGAVAGVQVDDGSNNLTFRQVTCVSDGVSSSAKGFDISSHPGEPVTNNIRIFSLTTHLCGNGLSIASDSSNIVVEGHSSTNERIALNLNGCSNVTLSGIKYVSDSAEHSFAGSVYGVGVGGNTAQIVVRDGSITTDGRPLYFDATATNADGWLLENVSMLGLGAAGSWVRFSASPAKVAIKFQNCQFRADAGNLFTLGVNSSVFNDAVATFDECDWYDDAGLSGALFINNMPNVRVSRSRFHMTAHDAVNLQTRRARIDFRDTQFIGVDSTRVAFVISPGVLNFSAKGCHFEKLARCMTLGAGSSGSPTVGFEVKNCVFVDLASPVFRVLGTGDERYVDNMVIGGNSFINCPSLYQGFPLGANATNVVAYDNNPPAPIPT